MNGMDELARQLAAALAPTPYHPGEGESCKTCRHCYSGKCHNKKALTQTVVQHYCGNYYRRKKAV